MVTQSQQTRRKVQQKIKIFNSFGKNYILRESTLNDSPKEQPPEIDESQNHVKITKNMVIPRAPMHFGWGSKSLSTVDVATMQIGRVVDIQGSM